MATRDRSRFWRRCRIAFRWFRLGAGCLVLALLGALLYLNQIGLPGFVKGPLLQKLRARGVDLEFRRLRWRWDHGIVAENVHFGGPNASISPTLTLNEVEVQLDYPALARLQLQVDSLVLLEGCLTVPLAGTNAAPRELSLAGIQTELRFLPGDIWELDRFRAHFAGGDIRLAGTLTNASAVRQWRWLQPGVSAKPGAWQQRLRQWADTLERIHFASPPHLQLAVRGNARDLRSFIVAGELSAPLADTPWGTLREGRASVELSPAAGTELSRAQITVQVRNAQTPWATATNLELTLRLTGAARQPHAVQADLDLAAGGVETKWGAAAQAHLASQSVHSFTNARPLSAEGRLNLDDLQTRWGGVRNAQLKGSFSTLTHSAATPEASWAWWTNLAPYGLAWECRLRDLQSPKLEADELFCAGQWRAPELVATRLAARLYGGRLTAAARLNVPTRQCTFTDSSDFDVQRISALLTEKSRHWLAQYSWEEPPELEAEGALILPEWTNRHPDWRLEVKPTVRLSGHFRIGDCAFRGVQASTAEAHFVYSNEIWCLPDLVVTRPEGRLDLAHESNERTRDYYFRVHSTIDVRAWRPLLEPRQQHALDLLGFSQPPVIDGEVRGRWYEHERIGAKGRVALTNFTLRGESADGFQTALEYTNRFLHLIEPRLQRAGGAQQLAATGVGVDYLAERVTLTNGFSTAEPLVVARAIGPRIGHALEPYRFLKPPTVRVNGVAPIHGEREADLHFDVDGGPFEWWKFRMTGIAGRVDWVRQRLLLRDVRANLCGGAGVGSAEFDFLREHGADFSFDAAVTNADLHRLMTDVSSNTNRLEGMLTARLHITKANSRDWQSWQGNGQVSLRDGLIWEIPVFGILSPVLDAILPGLGSSRASEGSATFTVHNGVISSDDLEIRASIMRLRYWGNVDLHGRVDAQAEAELLRDTWIVGRVLSLALWPVSKLFQYHITGTLHQPKSDPVFFVPRLVLFPFHPIRTFKDLLPESPELMDTNAPPAALP